MRAAGCGAIVLLAAVAGGLAHAGAPAPAPVDIYTFGSPAERSHAPRAPVTAEQQADLTLRPLVADGPGPAVVSGAVAKGASFFSVGVKHGVTGALTSEVRGHGWFFFGKPLPVGQPVYGIPMSGTAGVGMVWCAPRADRDSGGPAHWTAICLPQNKGAYAWIEAKPALMTLDLDWIDDAAHVATEPGVQRGPQAFPPMTLSYAYGGLDKRKWYVVQVQIDWGEGPQPLHAISVPPGPDGAASLHVMGGEIVLKRAPKPDEQILVEVAAPPDPAAPIAY